MANALNFSFSDLIAGYVTSYDKNQNTCKVKTSDAREYTIHLTELTNAELVHNLGEGYQGVSDLPGMLVPGRFMLAYGIFCPTEDGENPFEAKSIVFLGRTPDKYSFEKQDWWLQQIKELADFYLNAEFGVDHGGKINYRKYRTSLTIEGNKQKTGRQETDTISRLVYGFASAYLVTGEDSYLEAAEKGTEYLRQHMRFKDKSEGISYWYHAVDINENDVEEKILASEFGDDYNAIPCYEQIYALAGPVQTYRITGDPRILEDAKTTVELFHRYFHDDTDKGGYYSHIDPITFSPHSESLGDNKAKKNWNSVGDHAPAYLINLWLATGKEEYANFLEYTFDTIVKHFPDYDESPFVQEKFFDDWSKDQTWGWQQNRAVVGHNLKIAWNLTRMFGLKNKQEYKELAEKIGTVIADAGCDRQRGGWYDVVERVKKFGKFHKYAWHDRKAWWQQEQGILAYYIMAGVYEGKLEDEFLRYAREGTSFYNAYFLDHYAGGVYFNVLANGLPYALGTERDKGSHSMAGYHSFELCYLAAIYTNLLVIKEPMDFYFKPQPDGFPGNILRVAPDILPPDSIRIKQVWIDGHDYKDFDAKALTVKLPDNYPAGTKVKVRIYPTAIDFEVALLEAVNGTVKIDFSGKLEGQGALNELDDEFDRMEIQQATNLVFVMNDLESISSQALRYLAFFIQGKQREGNKTLKAVKAVGANAKVKKALQQSQLDDQIIVE